MAAASAVSALSLITAVSDTPIPGPDRTASVRGIAGHQRLDSWHDDLGDGDDRQWPDASHDHVDHQHRKDLARFGNGNVVEAGRT